MMKRTACIFLSLVLALTGLVGFGMTSGALQMGDTIEFGSYPQTAVKENTALKDKANKAEWISYGYYMPSANAHVR